VIIHPDCGKYNNNNQLFFTLTYSLTLKKGKQLCLVLQVVQETAADIHHQVDQDLAADTLRQAAVRALAEPLIPAAAVILQMAAAARIKVQAIHIFIKERFFHRDRIIINIQIL
jgi:hypothetical protein